VCALLQGLYLLRDEKPWVELDDILDDKWLLRADVDTAMGNVVARQVNMGAYEDDARSRVNANDRVNACEVYSMCRRPDFIIDISVAEQKGRSLDWSH
jgi:pantothenate kinase